MIPKICFFTVCGGGEEYDFLLGSIEHHARVGCHLVLDVSQEQRQFRRLPGSVSWTRDYEQKYGSGDWKTFRLATALEDARKLALDNFPDTEFLVHLDCDEYYDVDELAMLFDLHRGGIVPKIFTFETIHWRNDLALRFGPSEWHMRAWDVRAEVGVIRNLAWEVAKKYNGNPEHHPILTPKKMLFQEVRVLRPMHYHLHYAVGAKKHFTETAEATIDGWPNGTVVEGACPWPDPIRRWAESGVGAGVHFLD